MYTPGPQTVSAPQTPMVQEVPQPQEKPKAPGKSKGNDVGGFIQQCISLCSYLNELRTQAHLCHLNYEGGNFLGVHAFLKAQYEAHQDQFDKLGEFIRSMDYLLPTCAKGLAEAGPAFTHCTSYKGTEMLAVYYKNLEELGMKTKKLEPIAAKVGAIDIQNYMAELCGEAFKAAWQIKATLRNN
jgi:DNA-binding ferritin-like protein